jgi:hypothetical protein
MRRELGVALTMVAESVSAGSVHLLVVCFNIASRSARIIIVMYALAGWLFHLKSRVECWYFRHVILPVQLAGLARIG